MHCGITKKDLLSKEPDYEKVNLILNRMIELDCNRGFKNYY